MNRELESFPSGIFPPVVEEYIQECVAKNGFTPDYMYSAYLSIVSVLIGNRLKVRILENWEERPLLWIANIGGSGVKKTPAVAAIFKPLREIQRKQHAEYKKEWNKYTNAIENKERSDRPIPNQTIVDDTTVEALFDIMENCTTGQIMIKDELLGLIYESSRYSKTNGQEERLLSIFSGEPITVNRKGNGEYKLIPHPFLTLIGGIQPGVVKVLFSKERQVNGFISRLLFSNPTEIIRRPSIAGFDQQLYNNYKDHIVQMSDIETLYAYGYPEYKSLKLTPGAQKIFQSWQKDFIYSGTTNETLISYRSKLEGYAARIALVVEFSQSMFFSGQVAPTISQFAMESAIKICMYYYSSFLRTLSLTESGEIKIDPEIELKNQAIKYFKNGDSLQVAVCKLLKQGYSNAQIHRAIEVPKSSITKYSKN